MSNGRYPFCNFQVFKLEIPIINFQYSTFQISNFQLPNMFQNRILQLSKYGFTKFHNFKVSKIKVRYTDLPTFSDFQILRYEILFQGCPHHFLYLFKYCCDKYGVRGSIFGHIFGRSRNHPKSIAIDHESLISHLGIIKTPKKTIIILKTKKNKNT